MVFIGARRDGIPLSASPGHVGGPRPACEACNLRHGGCIAARSAHGAEDLRDLTLPGRYRRRQVIFQQGMPASGFYVLCSGAVKLYRNDARGREQTLGVAVPGDVLGEVLLDPGEAYLESAEALTDARLCYLPRERVVEFMRAHPMNGLRLIASLSTTLSVARKKVRSLACMGAASRLARVLLDLARAVGTSTAQMTGPLTLKYTRREIAEMIGVSTETAIRLLAKLRRDEAITCRRRALIITDPGKLAVVAGRETMQAA